MDRPHHQPHLENFFDAIRGKANLNCPAEIGYETAVTVLLSCRAERSEVETSAIANAAPFDLGQTHRLRSG